MRLPHPHFRWPRRRQPENAAPHFNEEDARLLRRTRLRLMAVSGGITLVILVVLGFAVYNLVSSAVEGGARDELERVIVGRNQQSDTDFVFLTQGEGAGLFPIRVSPDGVVQLPPGTSTAPKGLPDQASLSAVSQGNPIDIREITAPDGTPYRILSGYVFPQQRFPGWKVQWVQNRTGEVGFINTLALILLGGGAAALLVSILFGYLYAGRALVPIRDSIARRQAALQRQREFTANASHELRAPLTVIRASVEDLRRNRRRPVAEVGAALDDIDAEVGSLTALVEDMLFLARTDSGVVQLDRLPFDLSDEAAEAASLLAALGSERKVAVTLDLLPAPVVGDPLRLRQLVTILVDNAIRHSPSGRNVEVRVMPDGGGALLQVEDNGPGIKPEDLPRLWERFWRADDAPAGGTGLGLAIAKWIVEGHGGTIGAENRPEGGACFWARLPDVRSAEMATEAETASPAEAGGATEGRASTTEQPSARAS
jgi:signal transduction histidine kinase